VSAVHIEVSLKPIVVVGLCYGHALGTGVLRMFCGRHGADVCACFAARPAAVSPRLGWPDMLTMTLGGFAPLMVSSNFLCLIGPALLRATCFERAIAAQA
jgi:hypothetical protein